MVGEDPETSVVEVKEISMEVVEEKAGGNNQGGGAGVDSDAGCGVGVFDESGEMLKECEKF
jgi:hypothetical protein